MHPTILQKIWKEVSYEKALEKVMHRLREKDTNATISTTTISSATNNGDFASAAANHVGSSSQLAHQPDVINSGKSVFVLFYHVHLVFNMNCGDLSAIFGPLTSV